jgi:hypothetical protein
VSRSHQQRLVIFTISDFVVAARHTGKHWGIACGIRSEENVLIADARIHHSTGSNAIRGAITTARERRMERLRSWLAKQTPSLPTRRNWSVFRSAPKAAVLRRRPSPDYSWVGSCINSFEACSAFTHLTTCRLAKSPYATLSTGGSGGFVASTAAPIASTGWNDPVPGRVYRPLWSSAFHGAL